MKTANSDLLEIVDHFADKKVLVVGEAILQSTIRGKANRLDREAPVPVVETQNSSDSAGGAANCAVNIARLGARVHFSSVVGLDGEQALLLELLRQEGIGVEGVVCPADRQTLLKRKIYAEDQLVVRYDQGSNTPISPENEGFIIQELQKLWEQVDLVILSDYGQGFFTPGVLKEIARLQQQVPRVVAADTRRADQFREIRVSALCTSGSKFPGIPEYKSNKQESLINTPEQEVERSLDSIPAQNVAITTASCGLKVFQSRNLVFESCAAELNLSEVNGASDAFTAAFALSLAAGAETAEAAEIAAAFASIVVKNAGLPACCPEELKKHLSGDGKLFEDWQAFSLRLQNLRDQNKRIVFTNGVFDILHSAHVAYLNEAKSFGDILIVGVNTDESVRRLKGPERPINPLIERCRVLAGLSCVDFVVPFGENNPINLIRVVQPDIYVKGGDYTRETLPEAEVVESYGGELRILSYVENHSTTGVIERIRSLPGKGKNGKSLEPQKTAENGDQKAS